MDQPPAHTITTRGLRAARRVLREAFADPSSGLKHDAGHRMLREIAEELALRSRGLFPATVIPREEN